MITVLVTVQWFTGTQGLQEFLMSDKDVSQVPRVEIIHDRNPFDPFEGVKNA